MKLLSFIFFTYHFGFVRNIHSLTLVWQSGSFIFSILSSSKQTEAKFEKGQDELPDSLTFVILEVWIQKSC